MENRILVKLLIPLICCSLFVVGCGKKSDSGKVVIRFMHWEDAFGQRLLKDVIKEYEAKHPNVKIVSEAATGNYVTKLNAMLAANTPPDVFYLEGGKILSYANKGVIEPLDAFIAADPEQEINLNRYYPAVRDGLTVNGKIYALPKGCHTLALFYNKDHFLDAGIPFPNENWKWEDLVKAGQKLTLDKDGDGRLDQFGFIGFQWFDLFALMQSFGGDLVSADGKQSMVTKPETIRALQFAQDVNRTKYKITPNSEGSGVDKTMQATDPFQTGTVSMRIAIYAMVDNLRVNAKDLDFDVAPIPSGPAGKKSILEFTSFALSEKCLHKKEAYDFIKYLGGKVGARIYAEAGRDMPAYQDEKALEVFYDPTKRPEHAIVFADALKYAVIMRYASPEVTQAFGDHWDQVNLGVKTPAQAMKEADPLIKESLLKLQAE